MEIKTTEFFKNIKTLPPKGTKEFDDLIKWEKQKLLGGITVNGVKFSGWLYWHLNHWKIRGDDLDEYGNEIRVPIIPELRDNEWIRDEYLQKCKEAKMAYMEIGARQTGKDLLNSSLLYQEYGEVTIGDCQIGEKIYNENGTLSTIIGKYPQGVRPVYKVTLIDGREIFAGLDHSWWVYDRFKSKYFKKTTRELLSNYKRPRASWANRKNPFEYVYSIQNAKPVQYEEKDLELDPYILGLWLGDGSNYYSKITSIDQEIIDEIYKYAKDEGLQVTIDDGDTFMVTGAKKGTNKINHPNKLNIFLKEQNLYRNKHIPKNYLYSSIEQRMELLRGLMDTDGSCDKRGAIEFSTVTPQLADDFEFLCRSLGIVVSRKTKIGHYKKDGIRIDCKLVYRFVLYTDKQVFKLGRKLRCIKSKPKYGERCSIVDIRYVFDADTTCIEVDNPTHLFLTDGFTPTHNSELEASNLTYTATLFENSQNVIVGGDDGDLSLLKDKIDFGIDNLWEGIRIPKLDNDWRKPMVRLGYKKKSGKDIVWSYLIIRNVTKGKNTEGPAGTTAKSYISDEVGKYPFGAVFEAAKPAFMSKFGWRLVPMIVGTGGSFEKGDDAERYFYNPRANKIYPVIDPKTAKETGLFLSGVYRQDQKYNMRFSDWLIREGKIEPGEYPELDKITIAVADKEKAERTIKQERAEKESDPDKTEYLKLIMYNPLDPEECFMNPGENIFNIEIAKKQKDRIIQNGDYGVPVILKNTGDKIIHDLETKRFPISSYPIKPNESKDAPPVIYEFPIEQKPPFGLYTAGVDPYRQGKAKYSISLGSVYIFKRMHDIQSEKFQNMFVASYTSRPDDRTAWWEQARWLIRYYNARALVENDDISFIDYMTSVGDDHYLEPSPEWLKAIAPTSSIDRPYGISTANPKIRDHVFSSYKKYTEERLHVERDEEGSIIREVLGVTRIMDPILLEETIKYNEDGNFDRLIAASLAITLANHLDPIVGRISNTEEDPRLKAYFNRARKQVQSPIIQSPYRSNRRITIFS